jgi:hypothetical protein
MGSGVSKIVAFAQSDPESFDQFRLEFAEIFAKEFANYKEQGLTVREAQEKIYQKIQKEDLLVLLKIIRVSTATAATVTSSSSETATARANETEQVIQNNLLVGLDINRKKHALKFICCVDGSEGSDLAFKTTMRLWKRHDHVILFHAFHESKQNELPPLYRAQNVKQRYEGQVFERGIPSNQMIFQFEDKGKYNTFTVLRNYLLMFRYTWESSGMASTHFQQSSMTDATSQYMSLVPPDFILVGYNGRTVKGKQTTNSNSNKSDEGGSNLKTSTSQDELFLTMGSTTNITFRNLQIPCIICKRQIPYAVSHGKSSNRTFSRPLTYVMAIDHTPHSKNGLEILLQLIRSCDSLKLIHFIQPNKKTNEFSIHEEGEEEGDEGGEDGQGGEARRDVEGKEEGETEIESNGSEMDPKSLKLQQKYERILLNRGPKQTEVVLLPVPMASTQEDRPQGSLKEFICQVVNSENPDFFAIAPRSQQTMTSLTEYLIANIQTSIVLCKN